MNENQTCGILYKLVNKICYLCPRDCYDILEKTHPWIELGLITTSLHNMRKRGLIIGELRRIIPTVERGCNHTMYYLKPPL